MAKKLLICSLIIIWATAACSSNKPVISSSTQEPKIVEVTRVVIQTVVVQPTTISVSDINQQTQIPGTPSLYNLDQGAITIIQYYTLLDFGLYEEAYGLLSSSRPHPKSLQDFVDGARLSFKAVNILSVIPYNEWAKQNGYSTYTESTTRKNYYVEITAEGEGGMSGAVPNGQLQQLFLTLVEEDGKWKIYSFATNPPLP